MKNFTFVTPFGRVSVDLDTVKRWITVELSNSPYWMYSGKLSRQEVLELMDVLQDRIAGEKELLEKAAKYILFYVENIAFSVYLGILARGENAKEYEEVAQSLLHELRSLARDPTAENVKKMIEECLKYGFDPF